MADNTEDCNFSELISKQSLWSNSNNDDFYNTVNVQWQHELAEQVGLSSGCDIEFLKPYWQQASSIFDAGAGYGRVLGALLSGGFAGKLVGLERNNQFFQYLQAQYGDRVELYHSDICDCGVITERFDVIFLLWSVLLEFSKTEQPLVIKALGQLLAPGGVLIFDSITPGMNLSVGKKISGQFCVVTQDNTNLYGYIPTTEEIKHYADSADLMLKESFQFLTDAQRPRDIYILEDKRMQPLPNKQALGKAS